MDPARKKRWTVLIALLVATIAAIAYPMEDDSTIVEVAAPAAVAAPVPSVGAAQTEMADISWVASDEDPFSPRGWQPPPPPAPPPVAQPVDRTLTDSAPPPPPPLPYKFVGQMNDGDERVVYLSRGEQVLLVHPGDVLEGSYKILAIGRTSIEFELIASGLKQSLAIPAQDN
jgi:hypothetical protein